MHTSLARVHHAHQCLINEGCGNREGPAAGLDPATEAESRVETPPSMPARAAHPGVENGRVVEETGNRCPPARAER